MAYQSNIISSFSSLSLSLFFWGPKGDRLLRLQQAAELYLMQVVEAHTFVGIVTFDSKGEIRASLQQIYSDDDRKLLVSYLPTAVSTDAETNICAGVKKGFEVACSEF